MNVLVVDDNESVADSLAFLLDCYGHHAAVAYDGETALRLLRTGAFEITFLDENLPDINGSAIARSLRQTPFLCGALLVSMTGGADSQTDNARLFDACLQKPFSCETLMQVIEEVRGNSDVNRRQAGRPLPTARTQVGGSPASLFRSQSKGSGSFQHRESDS